MRMNIGANTTHFPNQYFTKVFPSFAATAHVLLNGHTIATITGTYEGLGHPIDINWELAPLYLKAAAEVTRRLQLADPIPRP